MFCFRTSTSLLISLLPLLISACDIENETNLPDIPPEGRFAVVSANQHTGLPSVEVAFALFEDGTPVSLVGGDVVQASTSEDSILILNNSVFEGSYASTLPNAANFDQIDFLMVHEPIAARQNRWYPGDLIFIDPGPGELVGASATITLPPAVLNLLVDNTNFTDINDSFNLSWSAETTGDIMKVRSIVTCTDATNTYTYATEAALLDDADDGAETIGMIQFIYDINSTAEPPFTFLLSESLASLQELLTKLKENEIGDGFFDAIELVNPITNPCEIQLFLLRQRDGAFDSIDTNGRIFGSRSADVTLFYTPPN